MPDIGVLLPKANKYQGLRKETINLEYTKISGKFPRLVCLGDSVTFGWNVNYEKSYPFLLEKNLKKDYRDIIVVNSGIGGDTIQDGYFRLESDVSYFDPHMVIISFGLNDGYITKKESIEQENENDAETLQTNILDSVMFDSLYRKAVEKLLEDKIDVVVMSTNPVIPELIWRDKETAQKQEEDYILYNDRVKAIAQDYSLIFIDIWEAFISEDKLENLLQPDGLHPNESGLGLISESVFNALKSVQFED
jgi:lysophospholipase L1-like esterase